MCGINGIYQFENLDIDLEMVHKMNLNSTHRGPDFNSVFQDDEVILGHNRLAIIDLNKEANQPYISNDKNIILTYNGEIYNYKSLRTELSEFYDFKTNSDTEVIVAAFLHWGIDMLKHFNGMFAFALWDKNNNQFYLCRDRLGIKPLYYFENKKSIVFSSSVQSINLFIENKSKINKNDLFDFLSYGTVHSPNTILNDIKILPRASYLKADSEESLIVEYWNMFQAHQPFFNYSKVIDKTKELLINSVQKRLVSDVPFGLFLSGGIDSSLLVAAASMSSEQSVNTFSVIFQDKDYDESKYSRIVAEKYNTNHKEININSDDILHNIEAPFLAMDHPTIDGINTFFISKSVKEQGFKMAISGTGADELFAGYPFFKQAHDLSSKKWLYSFPPQLRNYFGKIMKWYNPSLKTEKKADILNQRLLEIAYYYPIFRRIHSKKSISNLLNLNNVEFKSYPFLWGFNEIEPGCRGSNLPLLSKISVLEVETYLQNVLLRDADQMGMANSIEIRVPFLDHELVEFIVSVNDEFKYPYYPKKLLVDSTKGWLVDEIQNRKKMGFVFPWEKWMKNELKDFSFESIRHLEDSKIFNMNSVLKLWNDFLKGHSNSHWLKLWTLVVLGKWTSLNKISFLND